MLIYVCDDEVQILNRISATIRGCLPEGTVEAFHTGGTLMSALTERPCDILFLDIDIPDRSGMEIAYWLSRLDHKPLLVFVTNHDELVYESFQFGGLPKGACLPKEAFLFSDERAGDGASAFGYLIF